MSTFSSRHGYQRPDADISIRHEAPAALREAVLSTAYGCGYRPSQLRKLLCKLLFRAPDPANWSETPNIEGEVRGLVEALEWHEVYDFIEALVGLPQHAEPPLADELNRCFRRMGVGWQLVDGLLEVRGSEVFELTVRDGMGQLLQQGRTMAASELHEALLDLSRRPEPEVTGAIQHALAALECVARDVCGSKDTLGDLMRRNVGLFPAPVDQIVIKAWGYTSNFGRHLEEGKPPQFDEAELMVGLSGTLCRYLARRMAPA